MQTAIGPYTIFPERQEEGYSQWAAEKPRMDAWIYVMAQLSSTDSEIVQLFTFKMCFSSVISAGEASFPEGRQFYFF